MTTLLKTYKLFQNLKTVQKSKLTFPRREIFQTKDDLSVEKYLTPLTMQNTNDDDQVPSKEDKVLMKKVDLVASSIEQLMTAIEKNLGGKVCVFYSWEADDEARLHGYNNGNSKFYLLGVIEAMRDSLIKDLNEYKQDI